MFINYMFGNFIISVRIYSFLRVEKISSYVYFYETVCRLNISIDSNIIDYFYETIVTT